ncbi:MAG: hypothetical protein H0X30_04585 [Anaerolineae bacterium]|nr:hypothetical protein [Anaerolineae bacterium]
MRANHIQIITIAVTLLISACSANEGQQTLVADNALLSTQIVDLRTTATYQADQLQQTQEYIETIVPKANRLRDELASTLQAVGIDVTLHPVGSNSSFVLATATATSVAGEQQPIIIVEGTSNVASTPIPSDASSAPSGSAVAPTAGQPMLFNLVTAEGVGSNDCALASVTSFTADIKQIYVVATAANITAGTKIGAQWYLNDTVVTKQDFTPKDDINNNCIWFYAEPVDFPFTAGSYRVDLLINDTPVTGAQASFTIQPAAQSSSG